MDYRLDDKCCVPKNSKLPFNPWEPLEYKDFFEIYNFAYAMTYGNKGFHRGNRSGGSQKRDLLFKFKDICRGKIGEFATYRFFERQRVDIGYPDLSVSGKGIWDGGDFSKNGINFSVKTSKHFSQILFLEAKDYTLSNEGVFYKHDKVKYNFTIFARTKADILNCFTVENLSSDKEVLTMELFKKHPISFDIPGYISNRDLANIIKKNFMIKKGEKLNGKTTMDADNYYVFAKAMKPVRNLVNLF